MVDRKTELLSLQLIQAGKGEALRIRAILRSLVPIEDLVGVISLPVQIPSFGKGKHLGEHIECMKLGGFNQCLFTQSNTHEHDISILTSIHTIILLIQGLTNQLYILLMIFPKCFLSVVLRQQHHRTKDVS